jgi:hypothetical protein
MAEKAVEALTEAEARRRMGALAQASQTRTRRLSPLDAPEMSDADYDR